jgi:hypothetical protein
MLDRRAYSEALADKLLEFGKGFTRGMFTDVLIWGEGHLEPESMLAEWGVETIDLAGSGDYSRLNFAFVGDALKVALAFDVGMTYEGSRVSGRFLDVLGYRVFGVKDFADFKYQHEVQLADFLDRLAGMGIGQWQEHPFTEVRGVFIPEPGYPWPDDKAATESTFYSAKARKWLTKERPAWLIDVEDREQAGHMVLGVNPCLVFPPEDTKVNVNGPVYGTLAGSGVMVAHSMTLLPADDVGGYKFHKHVDLAVESIKACGGLLFPSLSVGPIPASDFGPITLVAPLALVLTALKPYTIRKRNPAWVYASDAWTLGTSEFMRGVARRLFEEFHGHEDYIYGNHIWALGPPGEVFSGPKEGGNRPFKTTKELGRALKRRMANWKPAMGREVFDEMNERLAGTDAKYAYGEAKAREVVTLDTFPYLLAPETLREEVDYFVNGIGYGGEVIFLPDEYGVVNNEEDLKYSLYLWAWKLAEVVKGLRPVIEIAT